MRYRFCLFASFFRKLVDQSIRAGMKAMGAMVPSDGAGAVKVAAAPRIASREELDAALFALQMEGDCFVQLSDSMEETVRYISSFTTTIATMHERK